MKKSLKLSLGSVVVAGALGAILIPATSASAVERFRLRGRHRRHRRPVRVQRRQHAGACRHRLRRVRHHPVRLGERHRRLVGRGQVGRHEQQQPHRRPVHRVRHPRPGRAPLRARPHGDQVAHRPPPSAPPPYPPSGGGALGLRGPGRNAPETRLGQGGVMDARRQLRVGCEFALRGGGRHARPSSRWSRWTPSRRWSAPRPGSPTPTWPGTATPTSTATRASG